MPEIDTEALSSSVESSMSNLFSSGLDGALKTILLTVLALVICLVARKVVMGVLNRGLHKSKLEKSFHSFIRSTVSILLWFVTLMIVAETLGIDATSLLALVSIAGLAISLSVQDTLANLAGGLTILGTHPFKVGDYVAIGGTEGTIQEIGMVYTKLTTVDNRRIVVPNSIVADAEVTNYSTEPQRRVDLVISAPYSAPVEDVKAAILSVVTAHEKVLKDPAPFVRLSSYGDSAIEYTIRAWCENADYWDVYFDLLEQVKDGFDKNAISFPYPKMEVVVTNE